MERARQNSRSPRVPKRNPRHCSACRPRDGFYACHEVGERGVVKRSYVKAREAPAGTKWCPRCKQFLPVALFSKCRTANGGLYSYCRACVKTIANERYAKDPVRLSALQCWRTLKWRRGLTRQDYEAINAAQNGLCAICRKVCKSGQRLSVDHDHVTGQNRALLCRNCNSAIGNLHDDPDLIRAALDYVLSWRTRDVTDARIG